MRGKRFKTRREWHNTRLWAMASGFILFIGAMIALEQGNRFLLVALVVVCVAGLVLAGYRDRSRDGIYSFDGEQIQLRSNEGERRIPLGDVADVSLVERTAARDYLRQKLQEAEARKGPHQPDTAKEFMRYCTVDIGLTSFTFGLGRRMIDRMPDAKRDLVLLRLRGGEALLLSPMYNHDLVESLGRVLQEREVV